MKTQTSDWYPASPYAEEDECLLHQRSSGKSLSPLDTNRIVKKTVKLKATSHIPMDYSEICEVDKSENSSFFA
jgi:hypothetical protein